MRADKYAAAPFGTVEPALTTPFQLARVSWPDLGAIDWLAIRWSDARQFQVSHAAAHGVKREAGSSRNVINPALPPQRYAREVLNTPLCHGMGR